MNQPSAIQRIELLEGDCLQVMRGLADESIDSVVTDPPYGLAFMGKEWDRGVPGVEYWREMLRLLKPGGHLVSFGGTRTYHRMTSAIEDAGFEIRDMVSWLYGSGFPKSLDVSKALDKAAGAEREVIRERYTALRIKPGATVVREGQYGKQDISFTATDTEPSTPEATAWRGWGTALKPALEPIVLARKPLIGTVIANVLRYGTGAINVDACRVDGEVAARDYFETGCKRGFGGGIKGGARTGEKREGRWPANVIHDGSEEVVAAFPQTESGTIEPHHRRSVETTDEIYGKFRKPSIVSIGDAGSAARFFYSAKADDDDRLGSKHPTVKPVDLMQWLVRLVTPRGGLVLDPFAGTGTTGAAAFREGMRAILIEREEQYIADIRRRLVFLMAGPVARQHEIIKAKGLSADAGPLFAARGA